MRLVIAPDEDALRRVSRGRVPGWGVGLALPGARTIVVRADAPDPYEALRHELAHLAGQTDYMQKRFENGTSVMPIDYLQALAANSEVDVFYVITGIRSH